MKADPTQGRLLLRSEEVPLVHGGPCVFALHDEIDADDPGMVTCPRCLDRSASTRPLTFAQARRLKSD